MSKVIIYQNENGSVSVTWPSPKSSLPIQEIAVKSTPAGQPFRIVEESELPGDWEFFEAWTADFSQPDGLGEQAQFPAGVMK